MSAKRFRKPERIDANAEILAAVREIEAKRAGMTPAPPVPVKRRRRKATG